MPSVSQRTRSGKTGDDSPPSRRRGASNAAAVTREALRQIAELTGRAPDTVSAVERTDDGWRGEGGAPAPEGGPANPNNLAALEGAMDDDWSPVAHPRATRDHRNPAGEGDVGGI